MEEKAESFIKLFTHFKESPLQFITLLVLLFGMLITYTQIDYIKMFIPSPAQERKIFEQALRTNELINASLDNTKDSTKASAVAIAQFHNGRHDLTRLPFTSVTITYYRGNSKLGEGVVLQTRPLSSMNHMMRRMWINTREPVCVASQTELVSDDLYRARLREAGTKYISLCPLKNILDYPIGYHAMAFEEIPTPEERARILKIQKAQADRITGYLQELKHDN